MNKLLIAAILVPTVAFADLGISDTVSESAAKNSASGMGITTIYDHPNDSPNGQFVVPIQYNRTNAEGNGGEHDPNDSKPNDIDYVPLTQLKGATGAAGVAGATGNTGSKGDTGSIGKSGNDGKNGKDGKNGLDGKDASIDHHLFLNAGLSLRWYDWKHVSLTSGYRYDFNHYNHTVDMLVVNIKLGKSYEQRELEAQKKEIESLRRMLLQLM